MRKLIFLVMMLPLMAAAQSRFGYFSQKEVITMLPKYESTQVAYNGLKEKCDKEFQRNEEELTRNYVSFLHDQDELPEPILRKRQKELQMMVDRSVEFRKEMTAWLTEAKDSLFAPLYDEVDDAVARVCLHNKLDYAIDLDRAGYVFVNPANGHDITDAIIGTIKQDAAEKTASPAGANANVTKEQTVAVEECEDGHSATATEDAAE